jgi:predicted kinase
MTATDGAWAVLTCGLPASGKTTTAERLHRATGGALIRSCDVYQALGIRLGDWVRRTRGFTVETEGYLRERDRAYDVMAERLAVELTAGATLVIVDAVHGERDKRERVYALCAAHGARTVLLSCRCDDDAEIVRRFARRRGRDEPEHEADDLSVYRHIRALWEDPRADALVASGMVPIVTYDTRHGRLKTPRTLSRALARTFCSALGAGHEVAR